LDPIAHTLTGAALARAGLDRRSPLALPTLVIAANLPDLDVGAYAWGETFALTFRRGWTHGVLAWIVLPLVLTGVMLGWDRWVRRARGPTLPPASPPALLALSAIGVLSHSLLDLLNVYGIRLLMPFSDRWFYGDALFIADPWLWLGLGAGVIVAGRRRQPRPARVALVVVAVYVTAMTASALAARSLVRREFGAAGSGIERIMVAPVPVTPFRRWVVVDEGAEYRVGDFDWLRSPAVSRGELVVLPIAGDDRRLASLRDQPEATRFLYWARFPFFRVIEREAGVEVEIIDARYAVEADAPFGALSLTLPR
jgi:inner membrane protein